MMKRRIAILGLTLVCAFAMTACNGGKTGTSGTEKSSEEVIDDSVPYEDVVTGLAYIDDGDVNHTLDVFGTQTSTEAMPTIIEVHGGAYFGGEKELNAEHAKFFARRGFNVVTPEYTKLPGNGGFDATVRDLFAAYQWVYDNAEEYHFDLNNISITGDSAGGYYVLLTKAIWESEELQQYFGVTVPDFDLKAVVLTAPGTDILALTEQVGKEGVSSFVADSIGADILLNEELMSHLDLYTIIDPKVYEGVYMITSDQDNVTGAEVKKLHEYLTENGVDHVYKYYEGEGLIHTFNINKIDLEESKLANQEMVDYIKEQMK